MTSRKLPGWPLSLVLLIGASLRIVPMANVPPWWDEVWSMWQVQGSFAKTLSLTPYDWPPLYYLLLRAWTYLVGPNDITGRYLSVLFALLGIACVYRAGRALGGNWAGVIAALVLAVLPYSVYLSMEARGYALLMLLAPGLAWAHLRWLHNPDVRRSLIYAVLLALCLYTSYTSILLIGLMLAHGLLSLGLDPSRRRKLAVWFGVLILLAGLSLPLAPRLLVLAQIRKSNIEQRLAPPGIDNLLPNFYGWLAGGQPILFAILIGLALIGLLAWGVFSRKPRELAFVLLWAVAMPLLMTLFRYQLLLVAVRYLLFIVPGVALALGLGMSRFPHPGRLLIVIPLLVYIVAPLPFELYRPPLSDAKPTRDLVRELGKRYQPGDQVLIDPKCDCGNPVEWSYYESIYAPGGQLTHIDADQPLARRVWYVADQRSQRPDLIERLRSGRVETEYFGPYYQIATLWASPAQLAEISIGDQFEFWGYEVKTRQPLHAGDTLTVALWWRNGEQPTPPAKSVTLTVIAPDGQIVGQISQSLPTRDWQPYQLSVYRYSMPLLTGLKEGRYAVQMQIEGVSGVIYLGSVYLFSYVVQ